MWQSDRVLCVNEQTYICENMLMVEYVNALVWNFDN